MFDGTETISLKTNLDNWMLHLTNVWRQYQMAEMNN